MAAKPLPSQNDLFKLLDYNPETGSLTWRPRRDELFVHCKLPHRARAIWNAKYAGKPAFTTAMPQGHLQGRIFDRGYLAHRVIWKMMTGEEPVGIDHINGIPDDNRWSNLREADQPTNGRNHGRGKHNTSGFTGVSYAKNMRKWHAYIQDRPGHRVDLGHFNTVGEAASARKAAERKYGYHPNHGKRPSHSLR